MPASTQENVAKARKRVSQAQARLEAVTARVNEIGRRRDTRRKIILGGLLLDAAQKDPKMEALLGELLTRISRDQDHKAFEGWSLFGEEKL